MAERPILMSAPMVRALLDGTKTQTRRVVKPPGRWAEIFPICAPDNMAAPHEVWWWNGEHDHVGVAQICPYGVPGDVLWVRESAWYDRSEIAGLGMRCFFEGGLVHFANGSTGHGPGHPDTYTAEMFGLNASLKKRPGIHMPRWASRITLKITDVRVERLQDISEADAIAEGLKWIVPGVWSVDSVSHPVVSADPVAAYSQLWDHINGPGAWDANPWVWALGFEVQPRP